MKWKSPRCSVACWDEIKKHDATLSKALSALVDMRRDRDEWKAQHENLLAMYRAALAAAPPSVTDEMVTAAMRAFERMSSVLRYREKDKWHSCDIMGMRDALAAALAVSRPTRGAQ